MNYDRLRHSIGFTPKQMSYFKRNKSDIQVFTRDAVEREIQRIKAEQQDSNQLKQAG